MTLRIRSLLTAGVLTAGVAVSLIAAPAASAALPLGYDVQKLDSPNVTVGGDFGIAMVSPGDLNGDGEADIVIGTDEHGGSAGTIFELSGADGSTSGASALRMRRGTPGPSQASAATSVASPTSAAAPGAPRARPAALRPLARPTAFPRSW